MKISHIYPIRLHEISANFQIAEVLSFPMMVFELYIGPSLT